jgi:hypothetical protein
MKKIWIIALMSFMMLTSFTGWAQERDYYQIKIYWLENETQEIRLDNYFKDAYLPALHRAGIDQVGVFKSIEGKNDGKRFVMVFIPARSLEEFEIVGNKLSKDAMFIEAGNDYIMAAHDDPPYRRIETILLRAFSKTPVMGTPVAEGNKTDRVYELRSYEAATEFLYKRKVEMFNEGESALFIRLGFHPLFFGEVLSSAYMPHLMYMITFADEKSQEEHWNTFRDHPDWLGMKDLERYQNTVSTINRYLMHPAEYSDL